MFFSLSPEPDSRFFEHHYLGDWVLSHDSGWQYDNHCWSKGYRHADIEHGNWVEVKLIDDKIELAHDKCRSFPLWWDSEKKRLTNLLGTGQSIWADSRVSLSNNGIKINRVSLYSPYDTTPLTLDQAVDHIINDLENKFQALTKEYSHIPKKLFPTGGVDTMVLLALTWDQDIEILDYEHFDYDEFTNTNISSIREHHWGYRQIHHWRHDCFLLSGAAGDEFLLRGPYTVARWCAWHDIDLEKLLKKSHGYHVGYFTQEKNLKIFREQYRNRTQLKEQNPQIEHLMHNILKSNLNDYQHWHLGRTLTWTPFKDLSLTKIILRLDPSEILLQILDAQINKKLIQRLCPQILSFIGSTKNDQHHRSKLSNLKIKS